MACQAACTQTGCPIPWPILDCAADVLRPVVATNQLGFTAPRNDLFLSSDQPLGGQREVHLIAQRLTVEVINDIEQSQVTTVLQFVVREVHRPDLINGLWHRQRLRLLSHQTLPGLDAQVQFQLTVDAVHPLVIPAKVLHIAQVEIAQTKAPVAVVVCQADQPVGDERVLGILFGLVAVAGLADHTRAASQAY